MFSGRVRTGHEHSTLKYMQMCLGMTYVIFSHIPLLPTILSVLMIQYEGAQALSTLVNEARHTDTVFGMQFTNLKI